MGFSSLSASPPPTARGLILSCAVSLNGVSYSCLLPAGLEPLNSWRLFIWGDGTPVRGNATMANG